jgi:hypothetical protein
MAFPKPLSPISKCLNKRTRNVWWLGFGLVLVVFTFRATWQNTEIVRAAGIDRPTISAIGSNAPSAGGKVYLPFAKGGIPQQTQPALLGIYSAAYYGSSAVVDQYLTALDTWAGLSHPNKGHALSGDFIDIEVGNPAYNIPVPLETLWGKGYTDFINMNSSRSAAFIAGGSADTAITNWANAYKAWVQQGGGRKAFLAPLPEMNGNWTSFGCDPVNYKAAYLHIQDVFARVGVTRNQVWWVFAPNGWSSPCHAMSEYYPGDANVDIVGFSSYNFGVCAGNPTWDSPDTVFGPYLPIIRNVAPTKPVFVTQTGSSANGGDKDQWLRDAYAYLALQNVRAVLYFNMSTQCDWRVFTPDGSVRALGYKDGVSTSNFKYYPAGLTGWTPNP